MDKRDTWGMAVHIYNLIRTDNCSITELEKLLKGADANTILLEKICDENLVTFSCGQNQLVLVKYFIEAYNLDVDAMYNFPHFKGGCSILCWACRCLKYDLVVLLLHLGADINCRSSFGKQPLHYVCSLKVDSKETDHSIARLVRLLVKQGANVNGKTDSGETPLMFACQRFHSVEVCKELFTHKAEINAADNDGNSSLHYLFSTYAGCRNGQLLNVLLQFGADINQENNFGDAPPDILIKQWCSDYIGFRRFVLVDVFLRIVQNKITPNRKYHMMEIFGAMSALNTDDVSSSVCFWTESSLFRSDNPDSECCRTMGSSDIVSVFHNDEELRNAEEFNFNDRSGCLKQAIIKSYRHLGFDYHLTLILCRDLSDFYRIHSQPTERVTFFTNMLDLVLKDEKYREIMHVQNISAEGLVLSFQRQWLTMLQDLDYVETEYTQKLLTVLLHLLKKNIHNAPLDSRFGHGIIGFIRHFSGRKDKMPKEIIQLLRTFIELDVTFVYNNSNVNLVYIVCESSRKPRSVILQVLLHYGMSANGVDKDGNTALHKYLLQRSRTIYMYGDEDDASVLQILRSHTHLDIANKWGVTLLSLLAKGDTIYPLEHITLKCLAAKVITQHELNFVGIIPKTLEPFVQLH